MKIKKKLLSFIGVVGLIFGVIGECQLVHAGKGEEKNEIRSILVGGLGEERYSIWELLLSDKDATPGSEYGLIKGKIEVSSDVDLAIANAIERKKCNECTDILDKDIVIFILNLSAADREQEKKDLEFQIDEIKSMLGEGTYCILLGDYLRGYPNYDCTKDYVEMEQFAQEKNLNKVITCSSFNGDGIYELKNFLKSKAVELNEKNKATITQMPPSEVGCNIL